MDDVCSQIVPIEQAIIQLPCQLDGSQGSNRSEVEKCQIKAINDYQAILCWLNEYRHVNTTYISYQKEAERLLLWCVHEIKKPLSSLKHEDFEAYFNFLADPRPCEKWCNKRKTSRKSKEWRPFAGPLGASSQAAAIAIIGS